MLSYKKNLTGTDGDAIVREIAERCATATLSQLSVVALQMNIAQLRGYARAHAWPQVWGEVQAAAVNARLTTSQANDLAGRVLERTVQLVTGSYLAAPVVAVPAPHIGRRAAA
jgi:hypothetical protein